MPEYVVKIKSGEVLTRFELSMLEARVKNFFRQPGEELHEVKTEVAAEYR